jgi:hypothetical protein
MLPFYHKPDYLLARRHAIHLLPVLHPFANHAPLLAYVSKVGGVVETFLKNFAHALPREPGAVSRAPREAARPLLGSVEYAALARIHERSKLRQSGSAPHDDRRFECFVEI